MQRRGYGHIPVVFWGVEIQPNKLYEYTPDTALVLSQASLTQNSPVAHSQVFVVHQNQHLLICTLNSKAEEQVELELAFRSGQKIQILVKGNTPIHLCGFRDTELPHQHHSGCSHDHDHSHHHHDHGKNAASHRPQ
eukprot:TRINITY_DN2105_c0_g1_i1.p1 TRINITY_DN2105_c0_g1~~TRINITY_DN2105_c0_g1_i1.p1  ORF type:complete len:155 (+),score=33.37 TRINITY_DN2105_c0_g1_i1:58-465(+)